jgi:glycosyltransferase involved in cell wall biosynthesis
VTSSASPPGPPLRLAYLGDLDGLHTRRWLRTFVERGHDVHFVSYYRPRVEMEGVTVHVLAGKHRGSETGPASIPSFMSSAPTGAGFLKHRLGALLPHSLMRLVQSRRYLRAGLKRVVQEIAPDVFQGFFAVEHGFYGAGAGYHPYVVSAWGSDLFVAPNSLAGRRIARYALLQADLVTCADPVMRERVLDLGVRPEQAVVVRMGVDQVFLEGPTSVNFGRASAAMATVISDRALEPLYNVDAVLRAFAALRTRLPEARLVIANDGSQRRRLEDLASTLSLASRVSFVGHLSPDALAQALSQAQVYVSVPDSDSLSLSTMEAMAVGAFPIVSDLASQDGWIDHGVNGLRVPPGDVGALAEALYTALSNPDLRWRALAQNRVHVATEGDLTKNMLAMERHYYRLAGRPMANDMAI